MQDTTTIAGRDVPVQQGPRTRVYFTSGCEPRDRVGWYDVWTMEHTGKGPPFVVRYLEGNDAGARFREMEGVAGYEENWEAAKAATLVRPATPKDLLKWLDVKSHRRDSPCARDCEINGETLRVVQLEDKTYALADRPKR